MSKVLFLSHHRETSGTGNVARNAILALDAAGVDVVPIPIKLGTPTPNLSPRLLELEQKSPIGSDVCVQFLLPHHMCYDGRFKKNIAYLMVDSSKWYHSGWFHDVNQFDEIWTPNTECTNSLKENRIYDSVRRTTVPFAFDTGVYKQRHDEIDILEARGNYVFYTISEYNRRKRITALTQAFHLEFGRNEPVSLFIKTHKTGTNETVILSEVDKACNEIKAAIKLYPSQAQYHKELLLTRDLPPSEIYKFHNTFDCFVTPSFGESWNIPAFDAMGFNNTVIASNTGGMKDYLADYNDGHLVSGRNVPIIGMNDTFPNLHSGREEWYQCDIDLLRNEMRKAYNNKEAVKALKRNGLEMAEKYSLENVGNLMRKEIEA